MKQVSYIILIVTLSIYTAHCQDNWKDKVRSYYNFDGNLKDWGPMKKDGIGFGDISYHKDLWDNPEKSLLLDSNNNYVAIPIGYYKNISISLFFVAYYLDDLKSWMLDYGNGEVQVKVDAFTGATEPSYNIWQNLPYDREILSELAYTYGKWHHLYIDVGDNMNKPKMYIDGVLEGEANFVMLNLKSDTLYLGRSYNNEGLKFYGKIDELRIFDQPLSEMEILDLMEYNPSNISGPELPVTVRIYPNPGSEYLKIQGMRNEEFEYEIISLHGKVVLKGRYSDQVDISELLPAGYYLKLFDQGRVFYTIFIKY